MAGGVTALSPALAGPIGRPGPPPAPAGLSGLSARERDILRLLGQGLSNEAIARALGLSTRTVKGHVSHVLAKLGLTSRTQAALLAHRLDDPTP